MSDDIQNVSWPGWETIRLIGRGSFGAVYEIERKVFNDTEKAALKVISIPQNSGDIEEMYSDGYDEESITSTFQSHLESIVAEYSLMRKLNGSANIVNCDDVRYVQHDDGIGWDIFIKMELLTPLTKAVPSDISDETVIKIAKDMCGALELCKKHGIVHRDIKPQNIFMSEHGDYKLGDFGIAKTVEKTMGGTKIGTYKYMAPEVYNNQPYGCGADIYSLGLVLYWLLNDRRMPFMPLPPEKLKAGMEESSRNRRLSGETLPEPVHGSKELKRIVLKACAYNPHERYQTATEMLQDIENAFGSPVRPEPPIPVPPTPPAPPEPKPEPPAPLPPEPQKEQTNKLPVILGVVAAIVVIIILLLLRSCDSGKTNDDPSLGTTDAQSSTTIDGSSVTLEQLEWSEWLDDLPEGVNADEYEIEEKTLYSSRTQETTSSTTQNTMDGWELYHTANGSGDYGSWTSWSTQKVTASETREVETQKQYRYRTKETSTSSAATKSGWELSETTYTWGNYGNWSNWSTSAVSPSDSRQVETKKQYCYREKETTTSTNGSLSGWTLYDTTYGAWGNAQTTTTKPTESDTLRITATTQTGWGWRHTCYKDVQGVWQVADGTSHTCTTNSMLQLLDYNPGLGVYNYSTYGGQNFGAPACPYNFYYWFRNPSADTYTYTYETRTVTNHFYKWSDKWSTWSDTAISSSSDREVKTQTLYRYRDREQIPTYHFWRWGVWSGWSANSVSETSDRDVESATFYRYRDKVTETTYYFRKWSDWSEYSEIVVTPSETTEVETKTQYRFKSKTS